MLFPAEMSLDSVVPIIIPATSHWVQTSPVWAGGHHLMSQKNHIIHGKQSAAWLCQSTNQLSLIFKLLVHWSKTMFICTNEILKWWTYTPWDLISPFLFVYYVIFKKASSQNNTHHTSWTLKAAERWTNSNIIISRNTTSCHTIPT